MALYLGPERAEHAGRRRDLDSQGNSRLHASIYRSRAGRESPYQVMEWIPTGGSPTGRRFARGCLAAGTLVLLTIADPFGDMTAWADGECRTALSNMTYPSEWTHSGQAPLVGGVYEEPAAPDSASKIVIRLTDFVAVGTIGDQTMAALVIATDPGGSGVFFDLYLVRQRENRWSVVDRARLGDRIRVNTIEVERELVGLDLTVHGPHDGACCPTRRSRAHYALQGERLVKVNEP